MIGHKGHPEVEGTMGQLDSGIHLVEDEADVARVMPRQTEKLALVTQTTLSMDDAAQFGRELYVITFSEAVKRGLLVDYKVIVLSIEEAHVSRRIQNLLKDENNQLKVDDAAKIIGCWKALSKQGLTEDVADDQQAMQRAVAGLSMTPELVFIDGNRCPRLPMEARAVVKGDSLVAAISAASILAKVTRDAEMTELDSRHPEYGFARHKGYPTAEHLAILAERGPLPEYRQSFKPVRRALGIE